MNHEWLTMLSEASKFFLLLATELSALFLLISAGVSFVRQKISDEKIQKILGGQHGRGYAIAALLGAVTPFCSCSTIPMLRGLLSAKAGFGPTLTFLFVSPLLNPIIVGLMWTCFGWEVTMLYTLIAAGVSVIASFALDRWGFERYVIEESGAKTACSTGCSSAEAAPVSIKVACCASSAAPVTIAIPATSCCCCATSASAVCCAEDSDGERSLNPTPPSGLRLACRDAWHQFKEVLPYLALGVLIGSFIYGFIPSEWIAKHAGANNPFAIPLSAVIGIPLYIRAEAVIPLAFVLLGKGMSIGAVMALIIGSAGASLTEVILLKSMFRTPMIVAFLTVILGMAILMGYLVSFLF